MFLDFDVPDETGLRGSHVACELVEQAFEGSVVVHSHNYFGAKMIAKILRVAGVRCAVTEFGSFEIAHDGSGEFRYRERGIADLREI